MKGDKIFIHDMAVVDEGALVGKGTRIWPWTHVMAGAKVGQHCNIGENCFIESGVVLGNGVKVKNNVALYSGVFCEDDVFLGPNCVFTNVINPRSFIERKTEFQKTVVRTGATIGANATIICGHEIGKYALVGAGSVVTHDVPAYAIVVGNPARQIGWACKCGCTLDESLKCSHCGNSYEIDCGMLKELRRYDD